MNISIVVPIYNEKDNIQDLYEQLRIVGQGRKDFKLLEILLVNDGSRDGSAEELNRIAKLDKRIRVIHFWRNYGQTAAVSAGIDHAKGEVIVMLDGDLQNDPADIPELLERIRAGYDVVSGWRKKRKDNSVTRTLPSRIANWLISFISRVPLHDYGCTLKAYRRELLEDVRLYGEMHRFIPIFASWQGASVTELVVNHRARIHGKSKYGLERTVKVFLDLILIAFMHKFSQRPMHAFGVIGLIGFFLSGGSLGLAIWNKLQGVSFIESPLLHASTTFFLFGATSILLGLIAEMLMRTYHESQRKTTYRVKKIVGGASQRKSKTG